MEQESQSVVQELQTRPIRILLLDDEPVICDFIRREILKREGFGAEFIRIPSGTGKEAIELMEQMDSPPELMFIDLRLNNGLSGFDVIDWTLTNFNRELVKIIILTGCWEGSQDWERSVSYLNDRKIDALLGKWGIGEVLIEINKVLDHIEKLTNSEEQE